MDLESRVGPTLVLYLLSYVYSIQKLFKKFGINISLYFNESIKL